MFYQTTNDLPKGVKDSLPEHAQNIYKDAFNSAYIQYADPKRRRSPNESQVETASRVACAAGEKTYEKAADGTWRAKA